MKNKVIEEQFKGLFFASFLSLICPVISELAEFILIGRIGEGAEAMAAKSIDDPLANFGMLIISFIGVSAASIAAQRLAELNKKGAQRVFNTAIITVFSISAVISLSCLFFADPIVSFLSGGKASGRTFELATLYLRGSALYYPAFMLCPILIQFLRLDGCKRRLTVYSIVFVSSSIIFDVLAGILFKGDVLFVALSNSITSWICFVVLFSHCLKKNVTFSFKPSLYKLSSLKPAILLGVPSVCKNLSNIARSMVSNVILLSLTVGAGLAAKSVQGAVQDLFFSFYASVGTATLIMTRIAYTRSDKAQLRHVFLTAMKHFKLILFFTLLLLVAAPLFSMAFLKDDSLMSYSNFGVRAVGIYLPFVFLFNLYTHYILSLGHTTLSSTLNIMRNVVSIICTLVLVKPFGAYGVLANLPTSAILMCIIIVIMTQIRSKKLVPSLDDFLMLDISVKEEGVSRKGWSVNTGDDPMLYVDEVSAFFNALGVSNNDCMKLALFTEEAITNIQHQGRKDSKPHAVQISAVHEQGGDCTLCIEDDFIAFNPFEKRDALRELGEDRTDHMGLEIICVLFDDTKYVNTMSTNTLMVRFHSKAEA